MNEESVAAPGKRHSGFFTVLAKVRIGFTVALVAGISTIASLIITNVSALWMELEAIVGAFALIGLLLFIVGLMQQVLRKQRQVPGATLNSTGQTLEHPLAFFWHKRYWGGILLSASAPIYFFSRCLMQEQPIQVPPSTRSRPRIVAKVPAAALPTNPPPAVVEFPELKVGGLIYNSERSTAVINKRTLGVGESIQGVKLVSVQPWGVIVEMNGQKKQISRN